MDKVRKISYFKISNLIFIELPVGGINFFSLVQQGGKNQRSFFSLQVA